jgi:predicted pyridoxine 5'-phosphate oxidase superfamily flavin-nucleotide-binding protein
MTQLTPELVEILKNTKAMPLATASKKGEPNVAIVGSVYLIDPETIWIGNQFMDKTIKNLQENPRASLGVWTLGVKGCFQVKGDVKVLSSGPDYEKMKDMVKARRADLVCKSLLVMKITEVYDCASGPNAGKKLV